MRITRRQGEKDGFKFLIEIGNLFKKFSHTEKLSVVKIIIKVIYLTNKKSFKCNYN